MWGAALAVDVQVNVGAPREPYLHSAIFLVGARRRCRERDRADAIPPLLRIVINKISHLTGSGVHPNRLGRLRSIAPTCPEGALLVRGGRSAYQHLAGIHAVVARVSRASLAAARLPLQTTQSLLQFESRAHFRRRDQGLYEANSVFRPGRRICLSD